MRSKLALLFATLASALVVATPTSAVTGNFEKDFIHPYVGLVVFYDASGEFSHRCSGTLIAPSVFLTAGHCTEGVSTARIYFQQDVGGRYDPVLEIDPLTGYPEECFQGHPLCVTSDELYTFGDPVFGSFPNTQDVGLVILDEPIFLADYPDLAVAGALDELATRRGLQDVTFTVSGYGVSRINPVQLESFRERLMATAKLVGVRSALTRGFNLQTSANPGGGRGGTCFGDSGGPVFYSDTEIIVAVTSFGLNPNCRGVDFAYRIDQADVLAWILAHTPTSEQQYIEIVPLP